MEGTARSVMCPRCGLQPEDDKHRFWQCPCNDLIAGKAMEESAHLVQWACEDFDKWPVFWARGIMPKAMLRIPEPSDKLATWQYGSLEALAYSRQLYLDGSGGEHSSLVDLRRCGWGIAALYRDADVLQAGACGSLPGYLQTVPRAELFAGIMALEILNLYGVAGPGAVVIFSDNQCFVDLANSDRSRSLATGNADLWQRYWTAFDFLRVEVDIRKVKAHLTAVDVWAGRATWRQYIGNSAADALAGEAAKRCAIKPAIIDSYVKMNEVGRLVRERLMAVIMSLKECGASWWEQHACDQPAAELHEEVQDDQSDGDPLGHGGGLMGPVMMGG